MPLKNNANYEIPAKGSLKFEDGEIVTYSCKNSVYRFPQHDGTPKVQKTT